MGAPATAGVAVSPLSRGPADPAARPDGATVVQAFSADLFRQLAAEPGNVVCSPYSVAVALAMTRNGARGQTAVEMDSVLHAPAIDRLNSGVNALQQLLESRAGRQTRADGTSATISLDVANSLWGQSGVGWLDGFLDVLARDYGAGMRLVDYLADAEAARLQINAWTGERTHGRIPELVPPDVLDQRTRLVLVNAIYLKAPWEEPFQPALTRTATFTRADGSTVAPQMMRGELRGAGYSSGPGWQAVDLPYAGSQLAMAVVVPDSSGLAALERSLTGVALTELLAGFVPTPLALDLPRWTFRTQAPLKEQLTALGMPTAFSTDADFTGMTTEMQLLISAVLHEAFIAVNEAGTEAAAATAVVVVEVSAQAAPLTVTVDRPFLFVIHDLETATPLFIGRVADPTI